MATESTVTTQAVGAALRSAGHTIAARRGISTTRAGAMVRKVDNDRVRVYWVGVASSPAQQRQRLDEYAATLRSAGFTVKTYRIDSIFIDVEKDA